MAVWVLDFLACGAIHEPHVPAGGSNSYQFFCVDLGHQEARIVGIPWQQPDQPHSHSENRFIL